MKRKGVVISKVKKADYADLQLYFKALKKEHKILTKEIFNIIKKPRRKLRK